MSLAALRIAISCVWSAFLLAPGAGVRGLRRPEHPIQWMFPERLGFQQSQCRAREEAGSRTQNPGGTRSRRNVLNY